MLPVLERLGLPATVYVTTWYCEHQIPIVNIVVDYLLKRTGASEEGKFELMRQIDSLPSLAAREQALRALAERLGASIAEWWQTRQFHLMSEAELADAQRRGLDIQLHTHRHRSTGSKVDLLDREIAENRAVLSRFSGQEPHRFKHF